MVFMPSDELPSPESPILPSFLSPDVSESEWDLLLQQNIAKDRRLTIAFASTERIQLRLFVVFQEP